MQIHTHTIIHVQPDTGDYWRLLLQMWQGGLHHALNTITMTEVVLYAS